MKEIIIATGNQDKFEQITNILTTLNVHTDRFLSLANLNIINDQPEIGDLKTRAKQKAFYCLSKINQNDYSKYLCIVGNDVGTQLPTVKIDTPESRVTASEILEGKILKAGEPINYVYSYAFILFPNQELMTAEVEIPFTYLGNPLGLKETDGKNTMSRVKAIPGQNIPHSQIPMDEVIEYRLKYLKKALLPIVNRINKLNQPT